MTALTTSQDVLASGRKQLEKCETLVAARPSSQDSWECFYEEAEGDRHALAIERLGELSEAHSTEGWPLFYIGLLHWSEAETAIEYLAAAADRFEAGSAVRGAFLSRSNRQQLLFRIGRVEEAGQEAELAERIGRISGDRELRARGRIVLARHLFMVRADLGRAYELLKGVEADLGPDLPYVVHRDSMDFLGQVATEIARPSEARAAYRRLLATAGEAGDSYWEAGAWYGLTRVAIDAFRESPDEHRRQETIRLARQALAVARTADRAGVMSKAHWILGALSAGPASVRHLEECALLAETARDRSYCLSTLARRLAVDKPLEARQMTERALKLAQEASDPHSIAFAWSDRMRVSWATGSIDQAIVDSWAALERIETLRDLQEGGSDIQAGLFASWCSDYHWFSGRLLEEWQETERPQLLAEGFSVSERLRSRALTDWLRAAGQPSSDKVHPAFSVSERVRAPSLTDWLGTAGKGAVEPAAASPPTVWGFEFATLEQVQQALGPREALLAFQVAPWEDLAGDFAGGSWVIAVSRQTVRAYPLRGRRELRQAVDLYTGLFEHRDNSEATSSAHLYRQLLAPVLADLPERVDRLILVPDDALHRLPFAALRASAGGEPLNAQYRLSVVPSASLWLEWRRTAPAMVLAEDEAGDRAAALVLAAPAAATGAAALSGETRAPDEEAVALGLDLPPLVDARREGRAVAAALGEGTELVRGAAASEALLTRTDLSRFGILHLASHAVTDEAHPERSAVVLAPGTVIRNDDGTDRAIALPRRSLGSDVESGPDAEPAAEGASEDGLLRAGEIAALDLSGKLVVLSSCRSAAGTVLRGEGVISLGRAFFQAGARTVVASLWPVRDEEAAALFEDFYRHLARGRTVAAALQAAQADRIAAGAPASSWAAFVVLGDGDLAPVPASAGPASDLRLVFAGAGAVLLALLVISAVAVKRWLAGDLTGHRPERQPLADLIPASRTTP